MSSRAATGEMIVGGKIATGKTLMDKDGRCPANIAATDRSAENLQSKGRRLLADSPDTRHQPKPDAAVLATSS